MIALPDGDTRQASRHRRRATAGRAEALRGRFPLPLTREFITSSRDTRPAGDRSSPMRGTAPAELTAGARNFLASGYRAMTVMPMMRGKSAIGTLNVMRRRPGPLSDKQNELLRTLRQPGRHRHREHAPVQRAARAHRRSHRIAGAADGDVGRAASHLELARGSRRRVQFDFGQCRAHLRRTVRQPGAFRRH